MPIGRYASLRYQVLDRCFSDKRHKYTIDDLLYEVNERLLELGTSVSLRQIRDDIKHMRDRNIFDASIEAFPYDGKKCYYRYADLNFSIYKNQLSTEEMEKLHSTIKMLSRYRGIPANAWLEEVISNLEYRFGMKANTENLISFEQNEQLEGLEYLSDIIDATINHHTLDIDYHTYKGDKKLMLIHPYYVKQYNGRWFLLGLEENVNRIATLALDRIKKITASERPFIKNKDIDFSRYFDDVVGVSIPSEEVNKVTIKLRFSKHRFPYAISKPIHSSQQIVNLADCTLTISVRPTKELEQQLFSFGPDIEVLQPTWYRELFKEKIRECLNKYSSMQKDCTDIL